MQNIFSIFNVINQLAKYGDMLVIFLPYCLPLYIEVLKMLSNGLQCSAAVII